MIVVLTLSRTVFIDRLYEKEEKNKKCYPIPLSSIVDEPSPAALAILMSGLPLTTQKLEEAPFTVAVYFSAVNVPAGTVSVSDPASTNLTSEGIVLASLGLLCVLPPEALQSMPDGSPAAPAPSNRTVHVPLFVHLTYIVIWPAGELLLPPLTLYSTQL